MTENTHEAPLSVELVEWHWLKPHHERDALWVVTTTLDLKAVGAALERDDAELVRGWLAEGALRKPLPSELASWNDAPLQTLSMLIVQPFVLVQERTLN